MRLIKKLILGFLVFTLTSLIILLTISIDLKKVIVNGVIMEVIKSQVNVINYKEGNRENTEVFKYVTDNEEVNEILESEEIQELVSKYLDLTIESVTDDKSLEEIDIEKDMMSYIREHKDVIEQKTGQKITEEDLQKTEEQIKEQEISKTLKEAIKETRKNLTEKQKKTLKGYGLITSLKLKLILIALIVVNGLFIILIERKEFKWIYVLANSLFSSGLSLVVMCIIANIAISKMANFQILKLSILLKHSIIETIIGLVIMIIYKIIKKITKKDVKKDYEISETSSINQF